MVFEMDDFTHKENIRKLRAKIAEMKDNARADGRQLTAEESAWIAEATDCIRDEMKHLPGPAMTLQSGRIFASATGPFLTFGDQMKAVAMAGTPGGQVDPKLHQIRASTGANETVPSDGGFLLQQDFGNEILQNVYDSGKVISLCRRIQISGNANSIKIPGLDESSRATGSRWGGVQSYWIAEGSEITASRPKFRQIELVLKKQSCLVYVTDELLQDAAVLDSVLKKIAADELAFQLQDAIIRGTGAGQPLGILNADCLVTVAKESGQGADTVCLENVVKMWSRLFGKSRANAVWLINQNIEPQLYTMGLAIGVGGAPVFLPAGGASGAPYMTLFGRPIIVCEHCSSVGDVGDIILADFTGGYILAEKGGVQSAASIHVQFKYDELVFRFIMRVDGQPVLKSAITPYKGTSDHTQSHFVALAAR